MEVAKVAEAIISSSSDEEDVPVVKKQAATKRRTYKPVSMDALPSCGIYSTHQAKEGLADLKFTTLPQGFSLDDEEEDDEDDLLLVSSKYRKILPRTRSNPKLTERDPNSGVSLISESTPEKFSSNLRSPSPPPPPTESYRGGAGRKRTPKKVSKMLRQLDHNIMSYRITNALNESSPMTTPGGSSKVIDLESPSISPGKRRRQMTVKIRSRGGVQKFVMQMEETFSNVIETLARVEGVSKSWIKLMKEDDDISEYSTPRNADIRIADILDCIIIDPSIIPEPDDSALNITPCLDDMVAIKIQGQDRASKRNFTVPKDQPLGEIMSKYSESCGTPLERLKFMFDDEVINSSDTPEYLDMDEEGVIDVVISS